MEEVGAAAHEVVEELHAQVQHGHLPHPGQQQVAGEVHQEGQGQEPQKGQQQGAGAGQGALGQVVIDEPQGEFTGQHLQGRSRRHEQQQGRQPHPVGLQVADQAQQQRVAQWTLLHLVALEEGVRGFGHGRDVARSSMAAADEL